MLFQRNRGLRHECRRCFFIREIIAADQHQIGLARRFQFLLQKRNRHEGVEDGNLTGLKTESAEVVVAHHPGHFHANGD